jgi:hypothetical protein
MAKDSGGSAGMQSLMTEEFFYFFLRLRKARVRKVVEAIQARFPEESPEQLARRLIAAQTQLSFLGGALLHVPFLIPGLGQTMQLLGIVGGGTCLTRMHLYLILEIALLFGQNIDDRARVPEMVAVVAATGLASGAPLALKALELHPLLALPAAGLTASTVAKLIGEQAIRFYGRGSEATAAAVTLPAESMG